MNFLALLKLFGAGFVERELSNDLHKHVTSAGYAALADKFTAAAAACTDKDPDEVAHAIVAVLFSIH